MTAPVLDRAKFSRDLPLFGLVVPKKECQVNSTSCPTGLDGFACYAAVS